MLDEMFQQNVSKFAIFLEYENPHSFFVFHFVLIYFFPNEYPGKCQHRPGHSLGKKIKQHEMTIEKTNMWIFVLKKYGTF